MTPETETKSDIRDSLKLTPETMKLTPVTWTTTRIRIVTETEIRTGRDQKQDICNREEQETETRIRARTGDQSRIFGTDYDRRRLQEKYFMALTTAKS